VKHRLQGATAIEPGTAKPFPIDNMEILICNVDGSFYAIEDVCTHDGAPLDQGRLEGRCIVCPRHGATFDVTTGEARTLPAVIPVMTFALSVDGDDIVVEC
jgi:3-phenylpropionate/trans-cinnamate dioxygenase ferredoxin subunit